MVSGRLELTAAAALSAAASVGLLLAAVQEVSGATQNVSAPAAAGNASASSTVDVRIPFRMLPRAEGSAAGGGGQRPPGRAPSASHDPEAQSHGLRGPVRVGRGQRD